MDFSDDRIGKALELIYDAAAEPDLWSHALAEIADLTRSEGGILFGQSITAKQVYFEFNGRMSEECSRTYQERHMHNPYSLYMQTQPVGRLVLSDEAMPLPELQKTGFYDDVLRPQGVTHSGMIALVARDEFRAAFNICRTVPQGPLNADQQRLLQWLSPHLCRSLTLGFRIDGYQSLRRAAFDVLDQLADGVIVLDRRARMLFANAAAHQMMEEGSLNLSQPAEAHSPVHYQRLNTLIRAALLGAAGGTVSLPRAVEGRLMNVVVSAIRGKDVGRLSDAGVNDAAVMLFAINPGNRRSIPLDRIMDAYGLTRAEARIALAASSGSTVPETARTLGLSPNTIKTHMRRVFEKTEASGQAELAVLIATIGSVRIG
ncbi:hypothetical protein BH11PSE4_BH11PSE4_41000 [soil metagenome]